MQSFENEMLVAQNCDEYKSYIIFMNMSTLSQSCSNCVNYINGGCSKELFEKIQQTIKIN